MRVLFIHNKYQQRGGEDAVFQQELELLSQTEVAQALTFKNHSGWRGGIQFFISIWNVFSGAKIKKAIRQFHPEVIHVHNWHYAIGPLVVRTASRMGVPIILTIPNYRLLCPSATLLHNGSPFLDSVQASFPWKAIRNKVYRNSFVQTFWLAFLIRFHNKIGTWKLVDRYIVLTDLAKNVFVSSSLDIHESQFSVKPNFVEDPVSKVVMREDFFLFVGRLSEEKGIDLLLEAFMGTKSKLYIAGDGPLREKVVTACNSNPKLHYLGLLDAPRVRQMMSRCSILIFPSIWYEGMPMTIIEAFAAGTPVIASNLGAMAVMVRDGYNGLHFEPGNIKELYQKVTYWEGLTEDKKKTFSNNARSSFETLYTPEKNKEQLLSIYQSVIKNKSRR